MSNSLLIRKLLHSLVFGCIAFTTIACASQDEAPQNETATLATAPAVDPATIASYKEILKTASTILSAMSALNSLLGKDDAKEIRREISEISAKLDSVVANQGRILDALARLDVQLRSALRAEFIRSVQGRLKGIISRLDSYNQAADGRQPTSNKREIERIRTDLQQALVEIADYGPAAYQATISALLALASAYSEERLVTDSVDIKGLYLAEASEFRSMDGHLARWINEVNETIKRTQQTRRRVASEAHNAPRHEHIEYFFERDDKCCDLERVGHCRIRYERYWHITGSVLNGFKSRTYRRHIDTTEKCRSKPEPRRDWPLDVATADTEISINDLILSDSALSTEMSARIREIAAKDITEVQTTAAQSRLLARLNGLASEYQKLARAQAQLEKILGTIRKMREMIGRHLRSLSTK